MVCDLTNQCNSYFQIRKQTKGEVYNRDLSVHTYIYIWYTNNNICRHFDCLFLH